MRRNHPRHNYCRQCGHKIFPTDGFKPAGVCEECVAKL